MKQPAPPVDPVLASKMEEATKLYDSNELAKAAKVCAEIINAQPQHFDALHMFGAIALRQKQTKFGVEVFEKALRLNPRSVSALSNMGAGLADLKRYADAVACYRKALAVNPNYAIAHNNLGNALKNLGELEEAAAHLQRAVALKPDYVDAFHNLGIVYRLQGRSEEAIALFDKTLTLNPQHADAHLDKSLVLLLLGKFDAAWREYEWRKIAVKDAGFRNLPKPLWLGNQEIVGKRIFIYWEQGLGDTIQFCRYIRLVEELGAKVLFGPQRRLLALMKGLSPSVEIVDPDQPGLDYDFQAPLMSLPLAFRTRGGTIPCPVPYLRADPALIAKWRERIGDNGFRVGICWQGSQKGTEVGRTIPLESFAPFAAIPNVRLISLQKGAGSEQMAAFRDAGHEIEVLGDDFDEGPQAFLDCAAVMKSLDLVITIDTSIGHLAGALGVPTWIALQKVPDWRWLCERTDSPWYPTVRLFRQSTRRDWEPVLDEMTRALREIGSTNPA